MNLKELRLLCYTGEIAQRLRGWGSEATKHSDNDHLNLGLWPL